jgi:hypothetical protein
VLVPVANARATTATGIGGAVREADSRALSTVPGAGDLLCAVANVLTGLNLNALGTGLVNVVTQLLNNLVGALAGV